MSSSSANSVRESVWRKLCEESNWCCKICGAFPEIGKQFDRNICDDCQLRLNNYDPTVT